MAVKTDHTTEVIYEAMRQVLAARAIHNIFRMAESHLMVTSQTLRYLLYTSYLIACVRNIYPSGMVMLMFDIQNKRCLLSKNWLGVVTHECDPSVWETGAGLMPAQPVFRVLLQPGSTPLIQHSEGRGRPGLQSEFHREILS